MMRKMKCLAALLALCLLSGLIPAATMEEVTIDDGIADSLNVIIDGETAPDIEAMTDDGIVLQPEVIDLSGFDPALEDSVEGNDALAPNVDVGDTLVHIVKPVDGAKVDTGNLEIWLTWTNPGGTARDMAAKLLPTTIQLIQGGSVIAEQSIASGNITFTAEGAHYLDVTLSGPGEYIVRAQTPGGSGYSQVTVEAVGAEVTPTPKPSPEPIVTVDENGFGVDQTGVLRQYDGDATDIVIPQSVNAIGEFVFDGKTVNSLTTHSGVKRILDSAFYQCAPLDNVTLAEGLEFIDAVAFWNSGIKTLNLPGGVTTIWDAAFSHCAQLESVSIPASVKWMGTSVFCHTEKLKTVKFAKDCQLGTIDKEMFNTCTALENVNIPDSVKTLGRFAFSNCTALKSLALPDGLTTILDYAFENCTGLKELVIPASVGIIELHAFEGCSNLTLIVEAGSFAEQYARDIANIPYKTISAPTPTPTSKPTAAPDKVSLSKCKATVKDQTYTGKPLKPEITVKYGAKALKKDTDYTVTYKNNKAVGTATATLTGKGKYTGTKKVTFKILPPKVALSKLKAGTKSFTATWKKGKANTGYQLQYALKKSFSGAKSVEIKKAKTVSTTVKGLKTGKTYYVRVRVYRTVGKNTYYSAWSNVRSVKVK